jgi:putative ABC transport system ATP-binding protein
MAEIEAVDVTRSYRMEGETVDALRGVSMTIEDGDYAAIIGPSGSGKSTLMHLLGCLDRPTTGTLRVRGQDVATLDDSALAGLRNQTIGFVFQSFQLLPRTTALENVALPLVYRGVRRAERRRRAQEALEAVNLGHEPTGNLDTVNGNEIMAILERLNKERGLAVVLVTHEAEIAARARRIVRMRDGLIEAAFG